MNNRVPLLAVESSVNQEIVKAESDDFVIPIITNSNIIVDIDGEDSGNGSEETGRIPAPYHTRTISEDSTKTRTISPISEPEEVENESVEPLVSSIVDQVIANATEFVETIETSTPRFNSKVSMESESLNSTPIPPKTETLEHENESTNFVTAENTSIQWFSANERTLQANSLETSTLVNESNPEKSGNLIKDVDLGLSEKLQQERENRQAKLQQMLSKITLNGNTVASAKSNLEPRSASWVKEMISKRVDLNHSASSDNNQSFGAPLVEGPASELSVSAEGRVLSLADEFASMAINTNGHHPFLLPGQLNENPINGVSH